MKAKYIIYMVVAALMLTTSCSSNKQEKYKIGTSKYYKDFLLSKYDWEKVVLPSQSLSFEMEEIPFSKPITLQLVYLDKSGKYLPVNDSSTKRKITIFKGAQKQNGSNIVIYPNDSTYELKFRFNPTAEEGTYNIFLKIIDPGDLDQINDYEIKEGGFIKNENGDDWQWEVKFEKGWSPSEIVLFWFSIVIVALLVLWFALLRWLIFPTFSFDNLQVTYFEGESRKGREDCTLHGARKVICSASPKSQSGLNKLFCGRIEYLTNPFWTTTVVLTPCGSDGISVNEDIKAGDAATYRMTAMITAQNGPRRPFVVKRTKSEMMANISIA